MRNNFEELAHSILDQILLRRPEKDQGLGWLTERLKLLYEAAYDEGWDDKMRDRDV